MTTFGLCDFGDSKVTNFSLPNYSKIDFLAKRINI